MESLNDGLDGGGNKHNKRDSLITPAWLRTLGTHAQFYHCLIPICLYVYKNKCLSPGLRLPCNPYMTFDLMSQQLRFPVSLLPRFLLFKHLVDDFTPILFVFLLKTPLIGQKVRDVVA